MSEVNSPPEYCGAFPVREDITVIPADDPKKLKLSWVIQESVFNPNDYPSEDNSGYETDEADKFIDSNGKEPDDLNSCGWACIRVLEFLKGQPWNNLALNYVQALRPSSIRVIKHRTGQTADAYTWRVTVYLEEDNSTVKRIEQECNVGSIGVRNGYDLKLKLQIQKEKKQ